MFTMKRIAFRDSASWFKVQCENKVNEKMFICDIFIFWNYVFISLKISRTGDGVKLTGS